jgi:cytochrome c oxidase cbb3-type subunit 3
MSEYQDSRDNRADYRPDTVMEHEYDGIQEFDNRLPNWWLWIMYGTLIFGLAYWIFFHTLEIGRSPQERFEATMAKAQAEQLARMEAAGIDNAFYVAMSENAASVAEGREVWVAHCVACHLDDGRGSVGPNLTDRYWIHGCEPMDMQRVIHDGVAAKGMPAWLNQLGPTRVNAVIAYLLTIKDDDVPGKAPEGEPCTF